MLDARAMTHEDLDWAVDVLAERRAMLVPHAPLYWRPAADARERHRDFLAYVIGQGQGQGQGQGFGFRTDRALMIAAKGAQGWTVDDAWVPPDRWESHGEKLWSLTAERVGTDRVRFVCPAWETERTDFIRHRGLAHENSWWHTEVAAPAVTGATEAEPHIAGTSAALVPAPTIYDPGGPILFLHDVQDPTAIAASRKEATRCRSPLVVVDQPADNADLAQALADHGFTRHCDFFSGTGKDALRSP